MRLKRLGGGAVDKPATVPNRLRTRAGTQGQ